MNAKKIVKTCIIPLAFAGIVVTSCLASGVFQPVSAAWSEVNYQEEYEFGSVFEVEQRTITIDEREVDAFSTLIYPDGTSTSQKIVTLNQSGAYIVKYTAIVDDKSYVDTAHFIVKYKTIPLGDNSSISYGKHHLAREKSGLLVRLAEGETLDFNYVIDIDKLTPSDALCNVFATPDVAGVMEFGLLTLRLTDVENPSSYLDISMTQSFEGNDFPHTYVKAGGDGQIQEGWESAKNALHRGGAGGTPVFHNFGSCTYGYKPVSSDGWNMSLYFDKEAKQVSVNGIFVIDLDSTDYYTTLWKGFTSNKVKLSFVASDYKGSGTANFCISSLYGQTLSEDLIDHKEEDNEAPIIDVATNYDNLPPAKVNTKYPIPDATAIDAFSGDRNVKTEVFYNYFSNNKTNVNIQGGFVTPIHPGTYSVVYTSVDAIGNKAKIVMNFIAQNSLEDLQVNVSGYTDEVLLGTDMEFPEPVITGGSGDATYYTQVTHNGETVKVKGKYTPEEQGQYEVKYIATDYINQTASATYNVNVLPNPTLLFQDTPRLPKAFIAGGTYKFEKYEISDYSSGKLVKHECEIKVSDKNGTKTVAVGDNYIPSVNSNGDNVLVEYSYGTYRKSYSIPTIINYVTESGRPRLYMERYLVGQNLDFEKATDHIAVSSAAGGTSSWIFANSLLQKNLELVFNSYDGNTNFKKMNIYLIDEFDDDNQIKVTLENEQTYTNINIENEIIQSSFGFNSEAKDNSITIKYNDGKIYIGSFSKTLNNRVDGKPFEGFNSDKVWVKVETEEADVGSTYAIANIGGQPLGSTTRDRVGPNVVYVGDHGGSFKKDSIINIPNVIRASDVLDPNITFTLTVTKDGKVVSSTNGVSLNGVNPDADYSFAAKEYGQYLATYVAKDITSGNKTEYTYAFNILDDEAPTITFTSSYKTEMKLGDTFNIPSFSVVDNYSSSSNIRTMMMITNPQGRQFLVTGSSYKPAACGNYLFQVYAYDEYSNLAISTIAFTVTQ